LKDRREVDLIVGGGGLGIKCVKKNAETIKCIKCLQEQ